MSRASKSPVIQEAEDDSEIQAIAPSETPDVALERALSELGAAASDARIHVYRVSDSRAPDAYLYSCGPEEFQIDDLARRYGGGLYRVDVRMKSNRHYTSRRVAIETPKRTPTEQDPAAMLSPLIQTMSAGFEGLGKLIAAGQQQPARSEMERMKETIQLLAMMREAIAPPAAVAPVPAQNPMDLVQLAVELAGKISPRESPPDSMEVLMEAVKTIGPLFVKASEQPAPPVPALPPPAARKPAPRPAAPPPFAPSAPEAAMPTIFGLPAIYRPMVDFVIAQAAANNDPATYAAMILDTVEPAALAPMINSPTWWETLQAAEPRVAPHQEWFGELREHLVDGLTLMENPETISSNAAPPGSDQSDADADPGGG